MLNETHLRRLLREYLIYYHEARTHLSLDKDAPEPRLVEHLAAPIERHVGCCAFYLLRLPRQH